MRYRCEAGSTNRALKKVDHVKDCGRLIKVKGYRFTSTRGKGAERYTNSHEYVMVVGDRGTARFNGFCWGYGGEGPRGLVTFLISLGISQVEAEKIAFHTVRQNVDGIDWIYIFPLEK